MTSLAARPTRALSSSLRTKALSTALLFLCNVVMFCATTAPAASAQTFTSLYSFCSQTNCPDGSRPTAELVQGLDGNLYGTASGGGTNGVGTTFNISTSGTLNVLHSFDETDGLNPYSGLLLASDGNFYGTTSSGGKLTLGNAFKMTPSGTVTQVYSFCSKQGCPDGANPQAALVQGPDGNFYGTTDMGGDGSCHGNGVGCGIVFKVTPSGTLTVLHAFSGSPDGLSPYAGLVLGADGNFYGTTQQGGTGDNKTCIENSGLGCGTVFRITPSGTLTILYNFCSLTNCADGYGPQAGLVQGLDGNFYGTAHWGGIDKDGTVFRMTPGGSLTTLHSFAGYPKDGANPIGGLIQATDGNFYGTTPSAGAHFTGGTIYQMTPGGALSTLYSFCALPHCNDGSAPYDTLLQATDGNLYGTTSMGGNGCNGGFCGTVFKVSTGLPPFVTIQPTIGPVGTPVTILGTNLGGATNVAFNGTARHLQGRFIVRDHDYRSCRCIHRRRASYRPWHHHHQQYLLPGCRSDTAHSGRTLPPNRHPQRQSDSRWHIAELHRSSAWRMQDSYQCRSLLVECHRGPARTAELSHHLAGGRSPAVGLYHELA